MEAIKSISGVAFADKVRIFSWDYLRCFLYISRCDESTYFFNKMLYSKLIYTSQLLEDFLDFHGAKNNNKWYYYRELAAAVRHLSISSYSQRHISNRLASYDIPDIENFGSQGEATLDFLAKSLMKMAPAILEEARRLNIPIPDKGYETRDFPTVTTGEILDYDIDDQDKDQQKKNIVKIASEFLSITHKFDQLGFYKPYKMEEILMIVPDKVNEVSIRRYEMLVHNLQSSFDTYVIHGGYRFGNRKLKQLRGFFSVVFHLLQLTGRLLHFYERHLYEAGYKNIYKVVQDRLSALIDPEMLLDRAVNYGLYYVCNFLTTGTELAREILNENIERSSITVGIPEKLGFHSRPSLLVAKIVQHYGGQVDLCVGKDRFDAGSVLDIQWAGGKIQKENISEVTFEGDVRSLRDIEILAGINYGEDTMGKGIPLPKELKYLK
ncbi:MAG TPA: HPr family phosphocarrier protein [Desulfobacterales bacterium]|nr:HPr family phosphocarrier protein [Desulfobacterales bacterium]